MATAVPASPSPQVASGSLLDSKIKRSPGKVGAVVFGLAIIAGVIYSGSQLLADIGHIQTTSVLPYVLLGVALLIALGFEFVNGFHDTANAVATVIYTHT